MGGLLEPDHSKRNIIIFIIALVMFAGFNSFYFIKDRGCREYPEKLKSCTPYVCAQRVMGFENKYMAHVALTLRREIIGLEKDKFYDAQFCNVIETNDVTKEEHFACKYSDKTRESVVQRSAILFGTAPIQSDPNNDLGEDRVSVVRASYSKHTAEQEKECVKK